MPGLWGLGDRVFLLPNFISQKVKVSPGAHLNTHKYNVLSVKLETKMINLDKIDVEKISSFLLHKYAVHDFWLLPIIFQVQPI